MYQKYKNKNKRQVLKYFISRLRLVTDRSELIKISSEQHTSWSFLADLETTWRESMNSTVSSSTFGMLLSFPRWYLRPSGGEMDLSWWSRIWCVPENFSMSWGHGVMSGLLVRLTLSSGARILQCCRFSTQVHRQKSGEALQHWGNTISRWTWWSWRNWSLMIRSSPSSGKDWGRRLQDHKH